jgi:hypothetical protein
MSECLNYSTPLDTYSVLLTIYQYEVVDRKKIHAFRLNQRCMHLYGLKRFIFIYES